MKGGACALDLLQYVGCLAGPDEGFGVVVVMVDVVEDRCDQLLDTGKDFVAQAIFSQVAEEALHHVQPRAASRREVHAEAGMTVEPALDPGMFMGGAVIHDHMDLLILANDLIHGAQELQPFLMAVPVIAHGDELTLQGIQGGKQPQ